MALGKDARMIYENRWVQAVKRCLDSKYSSETWHGKLRRSWRKRLLEMALSPIREELCQEQKKSLAHLEEEPVIDFFYGHVPVHIYVPDYKIDLIQQEISMMHDFYEIELLEYVREKYLRDGMVYLDCGANIGNHTVFFTRVAKAKKVFAFEGHPRTYGILEKNVALNSLEDCVNTYNCVLGEENGRAKIQHEEPTNIGGTSFCEDASGNMPMVCIDDMTWTDSVDFVKMDVEGFEEQVLRGMKNLLRRDKPVLWVEIFPDKYQRVAGFLQEIGYRQEQELFGGRNYIFV